MHLTDLIVEHNNKRPVSGTTSVLHLLRERIGSELRSGVLEHGDRLPSVREIANELGADPRVALAAYQQLMEEGLVEIRSRSGVFATGAFTSTGSALAVPRRWMLETLLGAIQRDISPACFIEHVRSTLTSRRVRVAVIECNDDQQESMREELSSYFGVDVIVIALNTIASPASRRLLRDIDLIVSAGHHDEIAGIAAAIDRPFVITHVRPSLVGHLSRLLMRGPVYFLITDPRFGAKMRGLIAPMARSENFHVLVVDRDDLGVIPRGAPTYVMRRAQAHPASRLHAGRTIPPQRIFSEETGREILSHILELSIDSANVRASRSRRGAP
ncbi:MAG: GntR family transcriptional regulator [Gemmatimonadota bacterium]|nr:GntR family transcriptional regulator [Gemmatimonadota bacterium]